MAECAGVTEIPTVECNALVALYNSTNGSGWNNKTGWLANNTPCLWHGVTCAGGTNVTGINLSSNGLSGSIPADLGSLVSLTSLNLVGNNLSGSIPFELASLVNLTYLDLNCNQLSGNIPPELGNLTNLTYLDLSCNHFNGSIPSQLGSLAKLTYLDLISNQFSGAIPTQLGNLTRLTVFGLGNNELSGSIPTWLGNLTNLIYLDLYSNQFNGEVPVSITNLTLLSGMGLNYNMLYTTDSGVKAFLDGKQPGWENTQTIAPEVTGITTGASRAVLTFNPLVYKADAGYIQACGGPNPGDRMFCGYSWDKGATSVTVTGLNPNTTYYFAVRASTYSHSGQQNMLTSEYGPEYSASTSSAFTSCAAVSGVDSTECDALAALYNSTNPYGYSWINASGWLDSDTPCTWHGVTCSAGHVSALELRYNGLDGPIPAGISGLPYLVTLDLQHNSLSGSIPTQLGSLANLQTLNLSVNHLAGSIPASLGGLTHLVSLALGQNLLGGSIPGDLGSLSSLHVLYLKNNQLSGSIPAELGSLSGLTDLNLASNQLAGEVPTALTGLTSLTSLDLGYNLLYSSDSGVLSFLAGKQAAWSSTQTTAPTLSALTPGTGSIHLAWAPITYTGDGGYYEACSGTSPGIYPTCLRSADKSAAGITFYGLPSTAPLYFAVRAYTPAHSGQQNDLLSAFSGEMSSSALSYCQSLGVTEIPDAECGALEALYNSTKGSGWTNHGGWLANSTPCSWYGVTCSSNHVSAINLITNGLTGPLPPELGSLPNLGVLNLPGNHLSGSIPSQLDSLTSLQTLNLSANQLSGSIPSFASLTGLTSLNLSSNQLSGMIPPDLGSLTSLQTLNLGSNQFGITIPYQLGSLTNLTGLYLGNNDLQGAVPVEFKNLTNLTSLDIGYNLLVTNDSSLKTFLDGLQPGWENTQTLPPVVSAAVPGAGSVTVNWTPIAYTADGGYYQVSCGSNSGGPYMPCGETIDKSASSLSIGGLTSGQTYYFVVNTVTFAHGSQQNGVGSGYSSQLSAVPLTSVCAGLNVTEIPLSECDALVELYNSTAGSSWNHHDNWLVTNTPCSWYGVDCNDNPGHVGRLVLNNNNLTGAIPPQVSKLPSLLYLDLGFNQLGGRIPSETCTLNSLQILLLDDNHLAGNFPYQCGDGNGFLSLAQLNLSHNQMSGDIQFGLFQTFDNLTYLNLSSNQFNGTIPKWISYGIPNLQSLYLSNNQLSGSIPPRLGTMTHLKQLDLSLNQLSGWVPYQLGGLSNLQQLNLASNQLSGFIPPEIGSLHQLNVLDLSSNTFSQPLPSSLTGLSQLNSLSYNATSLCTPQDTGFQAWLGGVATKNTSGINCGAPPAPPTAVTGCVGVTEIPTAECNTLMALYTALNGSSWQNHSGWGVSTNACSWYGINCGGGHVISISLAPNHPSGTLPDLSQLVHLSFLDLDGNALSGKTLR